MSLMIWNLYRDNCPTMYRPIIDAMLTKIKPDIDYVPNVFGVIRQDVPDATDDHIEAAMNWFNRLKFTDIPASLFDPRAIEMGIGIGMFLGEMDGQYRTKDAAWDFIRSQTQFKDATDNELWAAWFWALEKLHLTTEEILKNEAEEEAAAKEQGYGGRARANSKQRSVDP
jgi:hypothetical protein